MATFEIQKPHNHLNLTDLHIFLKRKCAFTGKRPTKRAMELIRFYFLGYIGDDELSKLLLLEKTKA